MTFMTHPIDEFYDSLFQTASNGSEDKSEGEVVLNNNAATKVQRADRKSRAGKGRGLPKKGTEAAYIKCHFLISV